MKYFFSKYGFTVLSSLVISALLVVVSPINKQFSTGISEMTNTMTGVIDLNKAMGNIEGENQPEENKTYELVDGPTFNAKLIAIENSNSIKSIEFVDTTMPNSNVFEITGIDLDNDGGVVGWYEVDKADSMAAVFISSQKPGQKIIANENMSKMFAIYGINYRPLKKVNNINVSNLDVSNVKNMSSAFFGVGSYSSGLTIKGLSTWDTENVTDMSKMFSQTAYFSKWDIGDLGSWNVSNVINMASMFNEAGRYKNDNWTIGDLSNWDVRSVKNMSGMFYEAGSNARMWNIGDVSNWDTSSVTDMSRMFYDAAKNAPYTLDCTSWDVNNVTAHDEFNKYIESKITPPNWVI